MKASTIRRQGVEVSKFLLFTILEGLYCTIDGFDGFPRQLPDDCIEYFLFIIDSQLEIRKLLSALESVRKAAIRLTEQVTQGYIWQRDSLQLKIKSDRDLPYLSGTSYFGDSVEDEWLIVYLLRELTKSFENLWVRVCDGDGEFLLVEAAKVLPSWLSPEIDSNRVWLHQGKLKIISIGKAPHDKRLLSLEGAITHIKSEPGSLIQSAFIEAEAFYRLEKYPGQIKNSLHHCVVPIPRKLAYILHEKPAAVAPAVEAFYLRDPASMKTLLSPSGGLTFPPQDLVSVSVKFTKVLFAQLKSQRFAPPPAWTEIIQAGEKSDKVSGDTQNGLQRLELGMKLSSGFEMLATNAETKDNRVTREVGILLEDLREDGDQALPTDETIQSWLDVRKDDDESWMDIKYEDFERELDGGNGGNVQKDGGVTFGDGTAQADLRKIVSRFESFLNDDAAGLDGAELDEMDMDDDSSDDEDSGDEDKEVSFDEEQFARMMREMMGMPSEQVQRNASSHVNTTTGKQEGQVDDDEDEAIRQLAVQMEAELNEHGALRLDPTPEKLKTLKPKESERGKGKPTDMATSDDESEGSATEEVDIDYNLARNLLESFKSQAGMAGPASNMLGMMGMRLPRDEGGEEET